MAYMTLVPVASPGPPGPVCGLQISNTQEAFKNRQCDYCFHVLPDSKMSGT